MEVINDSHNTCKSFETNIPNKENKICEISSNWQINNGKQLCDTISIALSSEAENR